MNIPAVIARLCFSVPILFIGLLMVIDPDAFLRMSQALAVALRTFELHFRDYPLVSQSPEPVPVTNRAAVRLGGVCVAAAAVIPLITLGN